MTFQEISQKHFKDQILFIAQLPMQISFDNFVSSLDYILIKAAISRDLQVWVELLFWKTIDRQWRSKVRLVSTSFPRGNFPSSGK